jgi:hypothetical protein
MRKFITDFTFVRNFIDEEIVPKVSLEWRRNAFKKVISLFEQNSKEAGYNEQIVKFIQYIIAPCFHYALAKFNVDDVRTYFYY